MIEIIMNVNICKISEDINNWKWYAVFNTCKTHMAFTKKGIKLSIEWSVCYRGQSSFT